MVLTDGMLHVVPAILTDMSTLPEIFICSQQASEVSTDPSIDSSEFTTTEAYVDTV